jgi:hypothetical protein
LSLRALMLLVAVVGIGLGWVANKICWQRAAKASIEGIGGRVWYDWSEEEIGRSQPPGPRWLRRIIGDELFQEISGAWLDEFQPSRSYATSKDVLERVVLGAPRIRRLIIGRDDMSETAYQVIGKLTSLEDLSLTKHAPTDVGVSFLTNLTGLKSLALFGGGRLTDQALERISRLPNLESLTICGENLTDRGLEHLSRSKRLNNLYLVANRSEISNVGLQHLRAMPSLESLTIDVGNWTISAHGPLLGEISPAEAIDKAIAESVGH